MTASISTDFLAIIALCFTIYLARKNIVFNNHKNKIYISLSVITIILLLLEIATVIMECSSCSNLVIPHRIANIAGFSLCPVVPVLLMFFNENNEKRDFYKSILALPLYLNTFICMLSYRTGWIFFVDAQNQYTRGKLFILPTIVSMIYFVIMAITAVKSSAEYDRDDVKEIAMLLFIPVLGTIIQLIFKDLLLIWISTSMSLLLYYIYLRELQFKYDIQTGIRNRAAFEKEMEKYLNADKNAAIIMADLNNLKKVNDKLGHKAGDEIIKCAAKTLEDSFKGIGKTFRVGGDEFCVICHEASRELIEGALTNLDKSLSTVNKKRSMKVILAYGFALYIKDKSESIYSAYKEADKAMYIHKAKLKESYAGGTCK